MKHHFGDVLDRSGGHWTIVPNVERYAYQLPEWTSGQKSISIATISKGDANWELVGTFPNLEELTLHSPCNDQLAFVSQLWRIKRLRITHARPKDIDFIARLQNLEELVLEYVSGFDDISPIGELKKLRSLHIENLRRVSSFSGLAGAERLEYLAIRGTFDWSQPVESFDFLSSFTELEHLGLHSIKAPKVEQPLISLQNLEAMRKLDIAMNAFPLEVFAWIEANLEGVEGASRPAFLKHGGINREINQRDIRSRMPIEEFEKYPALFIGSDGKRYERVPHEALLLGRGQRSATGKKETVERACLRHVEKYNELIAQFREDRQ
ncbi:MAG: leucine-rich repeat domain-containing protein [Pseudomonadota bacterium]